MRKIICLTLLLWSCILLPQQGFGNEQPGKSPDGIKQEDVAIPPDTAGDAKKAMAITGIYLEDLTPGEVFHGLFSSVNIKGSMNIGLSTPLDFSGTFSPLMSSDAARLTCRLPRLSLRDLLRIQTFLYRAATGKNDATLPPPDLPLDFIKLNDVEVLFPQSDDADQALGTGTRLRGRLDFGGAAASLVTVKFNPLRGFTATGAMGKFAMGPLTVTGAGPDGQAGGATAADDCPVIALEYEIDPETAKLVKQRCLINGQVNILGANLDYQQELRGQKMSVKMVGSLKEILAVTLTGETSLLFGPAGNLSLSGHVQGIYIDDVQEKVMTAVNGVPGIKELSSLIKGGIFHIDNIRLDGSLHDFSSGVIPAIKVDCSIIGQKLTIPLPAIDLNKTPDITRLLVDVLQKEVIDRTRKMAGEFSNLMRDTVARLGEDATRKAEKASGKVRSVAALSAKEMAAASNEISSFSVDARKKLKEVGEDTLREAEDVVKKLREAIKKLKFW